jgi:hypothetical protein
MNYYMGRGFQKRASFLPDDQSCSRLPGLIDIKRLAGSV